MKARCFAGLLVLFCRASSLALTSSPVRPPLMRASVAPLRASPSIKASAAALKPLTVLRGGGLAAPEGFAALAATPASTFNAVFIALCAVAVASRLGSLVKMATSKGSGEAPTSQGLAARALQMRFLPVFWLLRMADWLQGPYFYEVYASKVFNGAPASLSLVSKLFLTGFGATALFGPAVGRLTDQSGRKLGTLAFAAFYTVGALTTRSPLLWVLLLGRLAGGIGTSLLFSAPEAWLVGEAQRTDASAALGDTFGLAYAGDALVAITAGQLATLAAGARGPSGPFELSVGFLAAGALLAGLTWQENKAEGGDGKKGGVTIREAARVAMSDSKILLTGAVQALFEGAMYIFVLQWPPSVSAAVGRAFGSGAATPYGTVFSCFMVCCLLGSATFGAIAKAGVRTELSTLGMLGLATVAMGAASAGTATGVAALAPLAAAYFAFELCVGMYFPSIGTLRSRHVPDSHRSVIMNLFGIPLNVLVISVFLSIKRLGVSGALRVATGALGLATACAGALALKTREAGAAAAATADEAQEAEAAPAEA
eukprot:Transcript_31077.p1 GENE.Transcript_31077~~Transcript_31077.p1  ORF type:complete len:542 (+),score=221.47 Transcript_31077:48-1673(+)